MNGPFKWPVAPICDRQLRDINEEDIMYDFHGNRLYRRCDTYKGGGGYDRFESIWRSRNCNTQCWCRDQFVVQLNGCPLSCPYCYVTPDGTHSKDVAYTNTEDLVGAFIRSRLPVFHLMGGAPAMYIDHWIDLIKKLDNRGIFHSDLLLIEHEYSEKTMNTLSWSQYSDNALYAVSIKGKDAEQFYRNTGTKLDSKLLYFNLMTLARYEIPFYITFTGMSDADIEEWTDRLSLYFGPNDIEWIMRDSFAIQIRDYEALRP